MCEKERQNNIVHKEYHVRIDQIFSGLKPLSFMSFIFLIDQVKISAY